MALDKGKLEKDIFTALDKEDDLTHTIEQGNKILASKLAPAIDIYVRSGDVIGVHQITDLKISPGTSTMEFAPPFATPTPGATISPGSPVPGTHIGKFGKDAFPGGKGKIV